VRITAIQAAECRLPLPRPIRLGPVEIRTRDFVVLRLESDTGLVGDALGYPRGAPLMEAVRRMAPFVQGSEVALRRATVDGVLQRFVNGRPSFVKAASLYDIALWDLAAREAGQPLHALLGACRRAVPVMVVAGYYLDQRSIEDVCDEVRLRVDEGYGRIKIMISGTNPDFDERLVAAVKAVAGDRLCADAHWAFRSLPEALRTLRRLEKHDLAFIEDPFGPHQGDLTGHLQARLATPLAYGEDLPDPQAIGRAIAQVPVLRLDATTCGGVTPAMGLVEQAANAGNAVLPHVFLPVHAQLAGALRGIDAVEYIPIEVGACPMFDLLDGPPGIDGGTLAIDQRPGAGFALRWDVVEATAAERFSLRV
jgi:L-alanine-DL-glutamate epimerase-like enolase superfamily enzyme